jgi:hypothetical protein
VRTRGGYRRRRCARYAAASVSLYPLTGMSAEQRRWGETAAGPKGRARMGRWLHSTSGTARGCAGRAPRPSPATRTPRSRRPVVVGGNALALTLSVSACAGMVVVGAAARPIGVDVEPRAGAVEHFGRAWIAEDDVLRKRAQHGVEAPGERIGRLPAVRLGPEPFGVTGEPLVQPDVLPRANPDAVAEPLVGEFVGDESLLTAEAVDVVGSEDRHGLRFKGNFEVVRGDHGGVTGERVRTERRLEAVRSLPLQARSAAREPGPP